MHIFKVYINSDDIVYMPGFWHAKDHTGQQNLSKNTKLTLLLDSKSWKSGGYFKTILVL